MFKFNIIILAIGFLLASYLPANAADPENDPQNTTSYDRCLDKASGSMTSLRECEYEEYERLDKILNNNYKKIMKSTISQRDKDKIKNMQRNWLAHRKQMMDTIEDLYSGLGTIGRLEAKYDANLILRSQAIIISNLASDPN